MNGATENNKLDPLSWLRANLKLLLLAGNGLILLIWLYFLVSQLIFEVRTRSLLANADRIEKQHTAKSATTGRSGDQGRGVLSPVRRDREGSSATVAATALTSATRATSGSLAGSTTRGTTEAMVEEDPLTWETALSTGTAATRSPNSGTTATALAHDALSSGSAESFDPMDFGLDGFGAWDFMAASQAEMRMTSRTLGSSTTVASAGPATSGSAGSDQGDEARRSSTSGSRFRKKGSPRGGEQAASGSSRRKQGEKTANAEEEKKKEIYSRLEKRALFGEPRPQVIQPMVEAILGESALVNGQWLKVGGQMGDSKVVEIGTDKIVMENPAGKRQEYALMLTEGGGGPPGMMPSMMRMGRSGDLRGERMTRMAESPSGMKPPSVSSPGMEAVPQISDAIFQRLTEPGGPFQGESREQLAERWRRMRAARMMGEGPSGGTVSSMGGSAALEPPQRSGGGGGQVGGPSGSNQGMSRDQMEQMRQSRRDRENRGDSGGGKGGRGGGKGDRGDRPNRGFQGR